jgi:hypothetical protein
MFCNVLFAPFNCSHSHIKHSIWNILYTYAIKAKMLFKARLGNAASNILKNCKIKQNLRRLSPQYQHYCRAKCEGGGQVCYSI